MDSSIQNLTIAHYEQNAQIYSDQYRNLSSPNIYSGVINFFPTKPSLVLDIGSGSGRDAEWMAKQGHTVIAVEPADNMRNAAEANASDLSNIFWCNDRLPELTSIKSPTNGFDFILCAGVLMHLPPEDRLRAYRRMAQLSGPGSKALVTLKVGGNNDGRAIYNIDSANEIEMAIDSGYRVALSDISYDTTRDDVSWVVLRLEK